MENSLHKEAKPVDTQQAIVQNILVVDDSRVQRKILSSSLKRRGYTVTEAATGQEAIEICKANPPDLVLSDWMMPGMTGLEFCKIFREMERDRYGYFILLTSKTEKGQVVHGLDVGADDFLTKPVNAAELHARIRAGERILEMEKALSTQNKRVTNALAEIQCLYDTIDRDLLEAKKLQQSLIRERYRDFGAAEVSLLLQSSGHVGGDLVGFFPINQTCIGLFSIDVSGHGITSAMMTARLAGFLSGGSPEQNLALAQDENGNYIARSPAEVTEQLNTIVLEEMDTEHYFTMVLAHLNTKTGAVIASQAGHPHPIIQRANGAVELCGDGGLPIGLIAGAEFTNFELTLRAGDRLFLMSDGVTECPDKNEILYDEDGTMNFLKRHKATCGPSLLEALMWDLDVFSDGQDFPDDISAVLLEFNGDKNG